jgi:hypothetical protein
MAKARKRTESASVIEHVPRSSDNPAPEPQDYRDRISMRAYELYLARGGNDGGDFDDWLAAEREIGGGNGDPSRGDAEE